MVSVLELGSTWLLPNRFDLTYTNVKTQKLMLNQTNVRHTSRVSKMVSLVLLTSLEKDILILEVRPEAEINKS